MQARYGSAVFERTLKRLAAGDRELIEHALPIDWIPIRIQEAFYAALAQETGKPLEELHTDVARESTARTLRTIWRVLLRFTSDTALVARAPIFFEKSFSRGRLSAELEAPGKARLRVRGWPDIPEFSLRGVRIGIETVLREAGRREVQVASERVPDGADLSASWKT